MHDVVQQAVQTFTYQHVLTRDLAVFFAGILLFVMGLVWVLAVVQQRAAITLVTVARVILLFAVSYVAAKVLGHVVADPRPYVVQHITPLMSLSKDNGFPSDHSLLAAALTVSLAWFAPRLVLPFTLGTVLVMLGRLGVAAHHTEDVLGSVIIVLIVALIVSMLPMPTSWRKPILESTPSLAPQRR